MFVPSPFANMDERHLEALIRDDFAGKAMAGILAASARLCLDDKPLNTTKAIAYAAYDLAADMLAERRQRLDQDGFRRSLEAERLRDLPPLRP